MHPAPHTGMVGVKLADVPLMIRRRYGGLLKTKVMADDVGDADVYKTMLRASEIEVAVEEPSDRTYFVPRDAFERVSATWKR